MDGGLGIELWDAGLLRVVASWGQTRAELGAEVQGKAEALEEKLSHHYCPRNDSGGQATLLGSPKAEVLTHTKDFIN